METMSKPLLITKYPIATNSWDHKEPWGTKQDNTHCVAFATACERYFKRKVSMLDIGCAGGGLVQDFLEHGHMAVGLEGSDYSLVRKRAAWGSVPSNLFTCDVTKPFRLLNPSVFDVVGCWGVIEHFDEYDLENVWSNVREHMSEHSIFCGLIGTTTDGNWHRTVKDRKWWYQHLRTHFTLLDHYALFSEREFPRGSGNGQFDLSVNTNPDWGCHFVATL